MGWFGYWYQTESLGKTFLIFPPDMIETFSSDLEFWLEFSDQNVELCCCCCWYWPPVCEVCPNYEVAEFQNWTLTTTDLGYFAYCYVQLLNSTHPILLPYEVPYHPPSSSVLHLHGIIWPPGRHPSPSQHTKKTPPPSLISPVTTIARLLLSPLVLTTPDQLLSLPLPRCCQNIF